MNTYTFEDFLLDRQRQTKQREQAKIKAQRTLGYSLVFAGIVLLSAMLSQCGVNPEPSVYLADEVTSEVLK